MSVSAAETELTRRLFMLAVVLVASVVPAGVAGPAQAIRRGGQYAAGYQVNATTAPAPVRSLAARFAVPAITCPSSAAFLDPLAEIIATPSGPLTTEGTGAYVAESCTSGPAYAGVTFTESSDKPVSDTVPFPVAPGNVIKVVTSVSAAGMLRVTMADQSTGQSFTQTGTDQPGGRYTAGAVVNAAAFPIPAFGRVRWHAVTVNGQPISAEDPARLTMQNPATGDVAVRAGPLSSAGTDFTTTFAASQ